MHTYPLFLLEPYTWCESSIMHHRRTSNIIIFLFFSSSLIRRPLRSCFRTLPSYHHLVCIIDLMNNDYPWT